MNPNGIGGNPVGGSSNYPRTPVPQGNQQQLHQQQLHQQPQLQQPHFQQPHFQQQLHVQAQRQVQLQGSPPLQVNQNTFIRHHQQAVQASPPLIQVQAQPAVHHVRPHPPPVRQVQLPAPTQYVAQVPAQVGQTAGVKRGLQPTVIAQHTAAPSQKKLKPVPIAPKLIKPPPQAQPLPEQQTIAQVPAPAHTLPAVPTHTKHAALVLPTNASPGVVFAAPAAAAAAAAILNAAGATTETPAVPVGKKIIVPAKPVKPSDPDGPDEIVSKHLKLQPPPSLAAKIPSLNPNDIKTLETCLDIGRTEKWRDDWIGNLAFLDQDVTNPDIKTNTGPKRPLLRWAQNTRSGLKLVNYLIRHVYHLPETPQQARHILANADRKSIDAIQNAVRRVSYDPIVLRQDGWTTQKTLGPIGSSGGPYRIGERVFWQNYEGVVIAYIHDHDLGDLWKAMWFDEFDTFDLEAEELEDARRRYLKRIAPAAQKRASGKEGKRSAATSPVPPDGRSRSARYAAAADFTVKGIEHGIVMAVSYARGARPGVFWPARIMHASEMTSPLSKRGTQRQKVDVIFLAPYWNGAHVMSGSKRTVGSYHDSLTRTGGSIFDMGPLFAMESIDVGNETLQEYPYDGSRGLDIDQLRVAFKFVGLPSAAFSRYVDAHRLAVSLKEYARSRLSSDNDKTTAGLFEVHPMSVQTALFPAAALQLPFEHILSQMPTTPGANVSVLVADGHTTLEPSIHLGRILDSMKPLADGDEADAGATGKSNATAAAVSAVHRARSVPAPNPLQLAVQKRTEPIQLDEFIHDLPYIKQVIKTESSLCNILKTCMEFLLEIVPVDKAAVQSMDAPTKRLKAQQFLKSWSFAKSQGEDAAGSLLSPGGDVMYRLEWRKACERIYKYFIGRMSSTGYGNGVSFVITDSLCNQHLTSAGCFERAVRIPAAMKAAKTVGAGNKPGLRLLTSVDKSYLELAEKEIIIKAHSRSYIKRMKNRCMAIAPNQDIAALTEDSDGNGGEDTKGSRGTWMAAIAAVGAAIQGVDMIMRGECVNGFCITRPPGHHAGRELHPMNAVSNGFCVLNTVACAALYAASAVSDNGIGLRRVCVIDIDVHHGNGTQDILGSTYDPRFLYVSVHSGGPQVNGVDPGDDGDMPSHHLGRQGSKGIYPGRCGDTSPHPGVLNIPLGPKVTPHALGTALITKMKPTVEKFAPELIIVSAGFDAHKNDPLGLGGLAAKDFATLTEVICQVALRICGGRVLSVLEGGYGVPCCRPPETQFLPDNLKPSAGGGGMGTSSQTAAAAGTSGKATANGSSGASSAQTVQQVMQQLKPIQLLDLGDELPANMPDPVTYNLGKRLEKCHAEGFMHCVQEHVQTLGKCNTLS